MIGMLKTLVPYALILYMMYRSLKEPIFFLGVPFLMFIRSSIFFEHVQIFYTPGSIGSDMSLLLWLVIFWTFASKIIYLGDSVDQKNKPKVSLNQMDYLVLILLILTFVGLINVSGNYKIDKEILIQFFVLSGLFIGYFIVKDVILSNNLESLRNFLYVILFINTLASVLYIIHQGLHITIYQGEEYLEETFNGQTITRTFWFMPVLLPFSIAYLLVFENKKSAFFIVFLFINLLAVFISYTRSILFNVILIAILYFIVTGIKSKRIMPVLKSFAIMGITAVLFFFTVNTFFPVNTSYFLSRFNEIKENPQDKDSNSLLYRFEQTSGVINNIGVDKLFLGSGPITESQNYLVTRMDIVTSDLVWTGVIFRWGIVGFIVLVILHLFALFKAWSLFLKTDGIISNLALLCFLIIISQVVESFASYTFLKPYSFALGFWYFGLLSALVNNPDKHGIKQIS